MLKPAVRRSLVFAGMMAIGLTVVFILEDEQPVPILKPVVGTAEPTPGKAVTIRDEDSETETQFKFAEIVKDLYTTVELPDGRLERVPAYRIHILSGALDESGDILVDHPDITFLDTGTGEDLGSVRADQGLLESQDGGPMAGVFDMSSFDLKNITLTGNVHGELNLDEGGPATFDGSELHVAGDDFFAPGAVTLSTDEATLYGTDMRWTAATGELLFERVSRVVLVGETEAVLENAGGFQWFAREGPEGRGHGTLTGPLSGVASDGSRVEGQRLDLSDDASAFSLVGDARFDIVQDGVLWTMTAETITTRKSETGQWELTRAAGNVRLASQDTDSPSWFETEQIDGLDQSLVAMGPVRGQFEGFDVTSTGFRWNEPTGQLDLLADVVIDSLSTDPDDELSGAHVESPGGVFLTMTEAGMRARLEGPVTGSVPGMGTFDCLLLTYDETGREVVLDGSARVDFALQDRARELSGERIAITLDDLQAPSAVSARGDVVLVESDESGILQRLASPRLDVTTTLLSAPEAFELYWNGFDVTGTGLTVDDTQGLFRIDHEAHIARTLDDGQAEWVQAENGVTWWMPEDSALDPAAGHGEFRGPVSGQTADGILVSANSVRADGVRQALQLIGSAVVTHPTEGHVESEQLEVVSGPAGLHIRSPVLVTWTGNRISGHGTGFDYDEEHGHLSLERDVLIRITQDDGLAREITCDEQFTWTSPPGAIDPLMQGVGEFHENVVGRDGAGGGFASDRLLVDMPRKQVELFGECLVTRLREGELYSLSTEPSGYVRLETDSTGNPLELDATGRIELLASDMILQGDELNWNVPEDHVVMAGDCRLQVFGGWMSTPFVEVWPEAMRWYIPRNISKIDADR